MSAALTKTTQSPSGIYLRKNALRKYDAILKSACKLFLKHGYTHTCMDAIALDAGVSKQTVYSYFTNKDVLFSQIIEDLCNRHSPSERMLEDPSLTPMAALLRIGYGFMEIITSQRGIAIHRLLMAEASRHPRIAALFFESGPAKMQRLLTHYLERQVDAGKLKIDNIDHAASYFFAMLKGWHQMRLTLRIKPLPTKKELDAHVEETVRGFCKMYECS
jgi:TetR/AcrR family transcriptional regulator, mexJK operon transcriptional repressor